MLIEQIKADRMSAMKAKDGVTKNLLTTLVGELEGTAKRTQESINDDMVVAVCKKFIKNNRETMATVRGKNESAFESALAETKILSKYMPSQLTEEQLSNIINELGTKNIGDVMKHLNSQYSGQFDRGLAAKIAKSL